MKGYSSDEELKWLYPPQHMPPSGKIQLLTCGGIAIHGDWKWDGSVVAFRRLPTRDLELEAQAVQFIREHKCKTSSGK